MYTFPFGKPCCCLSLRVSLSASSLFAPHIHSSFCCVRFHLLFFLPSFCPLGFIGWGVACGRVLALHSSPRAHVCSALAQHPQWHVHVFRGHVVPSISVSLDSVFDNSCQTIYSFVICEEAFLVFYYISKSMNEFTMVGHADLAINITNCTMCCCFVFFFCGENNC